MGTNAEDGAPWELPELLRSLARDGDARLIAEIMDDFRTDGAVRLARMRVAAARGDRGAIRREAHSIKGSAAQMGAARLAAACQALETDSRADLPDDAEGRIRAIQMLFDEIDGAIARHPIYRRQAKEGSGAAERT